MILDEKRFRLMRLEDGEQVVMLRGRAVNRDPRKSDRPHAGLWGKETGYILVPCKTSRQVTLRVLSLKKGWPGGLNGSLSERSSDAEVLVTGPLDEIDRLISDGPSWCRARIRKTGGSGNPEALRAYRERTARPEGDRGSNSAPAPKDGEG